MDEWIWNFTNWIYRNYGRPGCGVAFLIMVSALALIYFLLNRLPESKQEEK